MAPLVRIGTRRSKLALTQSGMMQRAIGRALGVADADLLEAVPLVEIVTTGDRVQDRRLMEIGGKALFTKEIEEALLAGRVDVAVHSMKDVPADQPDGLCIAAVPLREDARDAFVSEAFAVSMPVLYGIFSESARATASVGLVIGASLIFNYIVAAENIPAKMSQLMQGLNVSALTFLIGVNILFLVLGCLLDATTIILVIIPLFIPTCKALGIDMVHFGVTAVVNCMIGLITPPYGVLLFVINAITGIPLKTIIAAIWPFVAVLIAALTIMLLVPDTVLFLPKMFGYAGR